MGDTSSMDSGQLLYILSRLSLSAVASFFAIMLWARTRDAAWMLMIIGVIMAYAGTVYAILNSFGIAPLPLVSQMLPNLSIVFFIAAFVVMVVRKYRAGA